MATPSHTTEARFKSCLIAIVIALIAGPTFAQNRDEKINRARRELAAQSETYLTEFNDMRLNFVNPRVQNFLSERLSLVAVGEPKQEVSESGITISENYRKKVSGATKDLTLTITYHTKPFENDLIVQSCQISGYDVYVADFFIKYWKTTLNFDDVKKQEVVTNYWITDRASLSAAGNQTATIDITKK